MAPCIVRNAVPADAYEAVAVLRDSIIQLCVADHQNDPPTLQRWLRNKTVDHFRAWIADPDNFVVVAERDGTVCGVGLLARSGDLNLCYLRPGSQRLGVGRAMLEAVEDHARSWGLAEVRLLSTLDARGFYERHGYVSSGPARPAYGVACDIPYRKRLEPRER